MRTGSARRERGLSRMQLTTYATPHDAASPIGVRVSTTHSGVTAVVCTDVGYVSDGVRTLCSGADLLVLESNHDEGMLGAGRIRRPCGHASRRGRGISRTARARNSCATSCTQTSRTSCWRT